MLGHEQIYSYFWGRYRNAGEHGEIPRIWIAKNNADFVRLIEATHRIKMHYLDDKDISKSSIEIVWLLGKRKIWLETDYDINSPVLKEYLKTNSDFAENLIKFLLEYKNFERSQGILYQKDYDKIRESKIWKIGWILQESELPDDEIKSMVKQIQLWDKIFEHFKKNNSFNFRYNAKITSDGYYIFALLPEHLISPFQKQIEALDKHEVGLKNWEYWWYVRETAIFKADAQTRPPTVDDFGIFWNLPDKKLRLILPHASTDEAVVEYYGYQEAYKKFLDEKKKEEEESEKHQKSYAEHAEKEEIETQEKLRNALLG